MSLLTSALVLATLAATTEGGRVALLVANDAGFADERPLRHTASDAERLRAVLTELGGFERGEVRLLRDRTAAEILDAVDALAKATPASMFVFYYSGHADAAALHPAGTILPLDLLLHRLKGVGAELRVVILDACQSGAAARGKGSQPAPPFSVRLDGEGPEGDIVISSSAADEQSFEGEHGGVFTLHLTAALRGAADENADGRVSLGEAYGYAYAQTLRSTLAASTGPQHARFRYELAGRRDPVLTQLGRGALLTLQSASDGEYVVFDGPERNVVAELPARAGEARRIALSPGSYVVQQRTTSHLRIARIALVREDDRVLLEHQMQDLPLIRLARKGSPGPWRLWAGGGQYGSSLGASGAFLAAAGVEVEGVRWTGGLGLAFSRGDEVHLGLRTRDTLALATGTLLASFRLGTAALRIGPAAGLAFLHQATDTRAPRDGMGLSLGGTARADVEFTRAVGVFAQADARWLVLRVAGDLERPGFRAAGAAFVPWGSYVFGLRVGF